MNEEKNHLLRQNKQILHILKKQLSNKITSEQARGEIFLFIDNVDKMMAVINQAILPETVIRKNSAVHSNLADIFVNNLTLLLDAVPESGKTQTMIRLPQVFTDSIQKINHYLKEDDDWLVSATLNDTGKIEEKIPGNGLSLKRNDTEISMESEEKPLEKEVPEPSLEDDLGYPLMYHSLSKQVKLNYILDPLFDLIFPNNTHILSVKHCKAATGKSLNVVLNKKLGPDEDGNIFLYKIISDDVLTKIFRDDKIITLFTGSLHIPLLKAVIHTALYRLQRSPEKFPAIGGVSYFIDFEEELLQTSHIIDSMFSFITNPTGARAMFNTRSGQERKGFIDFLEKDIKRYEHIYMMMPKIPVKAKAITRYWSPKFSSIFIASSSMNPDEIDSFFPYERLDDIKEFLNYMNP